MSSFSQSSHNSILGKLGFSKEDLEFERRERARVEARRQRDSERVQKLILNPKQRVMGIHIDSLTRQIQEKEERVRMEKERNRHFAMEQDRIRSHLGETELEEKKARRCAQEELRSTWNAQIKYAENQRRQTSDKTLQAERAKLMVFEGEDPLRDSRARDQKRLQREDLERQIEERRKREQDLRDCNLNSATQWSAMDRHQTEIEKQLENERRDRRRALAQQNRRAGLQRKELEKSRRTKELEEQRRQLSSVQMIDESSKRPLSGSQLNEIRAEQARQRHRATEREARRKQEKLEELQKMRLLTRELERADEESKMSKQEQARAYREELNRFKASRQEEEEKSSSGIDFDSSFFSKFGQSAR